MSILKKIVLLTFLSLTNITLFAQFTSKIPLNNQVAHGKLENGLTYYVLHNEWPQERADFYFVQNVGAILENDDQNGLAHFLEHMAFNGTEHYEGKGFIKMLERHGVLFGRDINAYTALDETVYNLSNVPVSDPQLLDSCLWVLHDWSGSLLLTDSEIDAERGVIHEEWRTRRTSGFRLTSQTNKILYKDSKYAKRDVIGDLEIIDHFDYPRLRNYYKKWYRPDLQAVIVVGDVDTTAMVKKIKAIFSPITNPENEAERYYVRIPENDSLLFKVATDAEAQQVKIALIHKTDKPLVQNDSTLANYIIGSMATQMMNDRYREYLLGNSTSSLQLACGKAGLSRLQDKFLIIAIPKKDQLLPAFNEALTEFERTLQHGFTNPELERAKERVISSYQDKIKNKDKISNESWASQLQDNFLFASPVLTIDDEFSFIQKTLSELTVDKVNAVFRSFFDGKNNLITITGPDKTDIQYPSKRECLDVLEAVKAEKLSPYQEKEIDSPLIAETLEARPATDKGELADLPGTKVYLLANGAKIVFYHTQLANDQILFYGFSQGGTSLLEADDLPSAGIATSLAMSSGLGEMSSSELQKRLAGKNVVIEPYISSFFEGISGSANQDDLETLLQLSYLYFEHPRFDEQIFTRFIDYYNNSLENSAKDNGQALSDTISLLNTNYSDRTWLFNRKYVDQLSFEKAQEIYKDRLKNAADFTFVLVGNLPEKTLQLVNTYLGNIRSEGKKEVFVDHHVTMAQGLSKRVIERDMSVPKTTIYMHFENQSVRYSKEDELMAYFISQVLTKRYIETIREEEGGSYGVHAKAELFDTPTSSFSLAISFDCDPDKAEKLQQIVIQEIEKLKTEGITPTVYADIRQDLIKSYDQQMKSNSYWLNTLVKNLRDHEPIVDQASLNKLLDSINPDTLKQFITRSLKDANRVEVIMSPLAK